MEKSRDTINTFLNTKNYLRMHLHSSINSAKYFKDLFLKHEALFGRKEVITMGTARENIMTKESKLI